MSYIWSYLRRYPKWLAMNFTAAILFVIANLGMPTVLARMIDEGINRGDADKLYTLSLIHIRRCRRLSLWLSPWSLVYYKNNVDTHRDSLRL